MSKQPCIKICDVLNIEKNKKELQMINNCNNIIDDLKQLILDFEDTYNNIMKKKKKDEDLKKIKKVINNLEDNINEYISKINDIEKKLEETKIKYKDSFIKKEKLQKDIQIYDSNIEYYNKLIKSCKIKIKKINDVFEDIENNEDIFFESIMSLNNIHKYNNKKICINVNNIVNEYLYNNFLNKSISEYIKEIFILYLKETNNDEGLINLADMLFSRIEYEFNTDNLCPPLYDILYQPYIIYDKDINKYLFLKSNKTIIKNFSKKSMTYYVYKKYKNLNKQLILYNDNDIIETECEMEIINIECIIKLLKDLTKYQDNLINYSNIVI